MRYVYILQERIHRLLTGGGGLRIDNSGRNVIYTFDHNSETALVIITCDIPNKRE